MEKLNRIESCTIEVKTLIWIFWKYNWSETWIYL